MIKRLHIFLVFFMALSSLVSGYEISKIRFVDRNGNPIPYKSFIYSIILKPGMEFSPKILSDDIKRLYETKMIKDTEARVLLEKGEYVLEFKMTLNVMVAAIKFRGNKEFSDSKLADDVKHPIGTLLDMEALAKDKAKIYEKYA